jgi:hypothetical protein
VAAPAATTTPVAGAAGDPLVPHLPPDNAAEPEVPKEVPPDRSHVDWGANLPGFEPAPVDHLLDAVHGSWPHPTDGCHLDGGMDGGVAWQQQWTRIVNLSMTHYSVPKG